MNLGPRTISSTYQFVLNASGGRVTLGDDTNPNWIGTTVASTTGTQTISGVKTFDGNTIFNGNVGVGDPNPSEKLDVIGNGVVSRFAGTANEFQGIVIQPTQSSASVNKGGFIDYRNENDIPMTATASYHFTNGSSDYYIHTTPSGSRTVDRRVERFRIKGNGDTVIGPGSGLSLEVIGGIRTRGGSPGANGVNNNGYAFSGPGDNDAGMFSSTDGSVEFYTNSSERMRIYGANIGIGITNPNTILHASGEITSSALGGAGGQFRAVYGNYGAFFRNDGNNIYLLFTDSGNQYGGWNSLRPFYADLTNGNVVLGHSLYVASNVTCSSFAVGTQTNKATISYATNTARTFTLPSVTSNSTFAFINQAQTFTSNQVINADLRVQGNLDFGSSTLAGTAHSSLFKTNGGTLGNTAGNTINLASIGFGATEGTSLSFIARRQSNGSNAGSSAIGLSYNTGDITGINNQQIWMLADGKVGIGTNAPAQKLDVNGNLRVQGSITCTAGIDLSNKNTKLTADISMPSANTWYNIVSVSLEAGTWLVNSSFLYLRTNNVADIVYCRISDAGTTYYASTSENRIAANNATLNLATTTIITLTSTTTIWLQAAQNTAAAANVALAKAAMAAIGAGNNATQITAIRVN